jgi:hypothetical protein
LNNIQTNLIFSVKIGDFSLNQEVRENYSYTWTR